LYSKELYSYADGDEQEYEDEEYTEYENEESELGEDIPDAEMPKFRQLVKNKKLELKAQYGKAKISVFECGIKPLPPDIAHPNVICLWDCSKSKNYSKDCCAKNRQQAQKRAEQRDKIAAWERCRTENKGIIVWGWRKRWRDFKRAGGLAQLRMQSKGLAPIPTTTTSTPSIVTPPSTIIPNNSTSSTPKKLNLSESKGGKTLASSKLKESNVDLSKLKSAIKTDDSSDDKILGMPKGLAIALGVTIVVVGGFFAYKKFGK
jgi:hypothetical protein